MDLQSYIQLKEAYVNLHAPRVQVTEEEIWGEVEVFAAGLVETLDFDLSETSWEEVREMYSEAPEELLEFIRWGGAGGASDEEIAKGKRLGAERRAARVAAQKKADEAEKSKPASKDDYADGVMGQWQRTRDKFSGNQSRVNKATSYDASEAELRKQRVNNGGNTTDKISQADINAKTKARREADPNYKPGQGVDSGATPTEKKKKEEEKNKPDPKPDPNPDPNNGGGGGGGGAQKVTPKPAKDRMANASKADRMSAWAKANPALAKAKASRDATRGTSATTNPLMRDLKNRMPKPAAPAKATPTKSLTGNKASSSMSSGGAKAVSPTAKPQPITKNTNITGNKASSFTSSGGAKAAAAKPTPAAVKPTPAKRPLTSAAPPKTGAAATNALNKFTKEETEIDVFDTILAHLIEQGFGDDEALILMTTMSEDKRQQMLATIFEEESDKLKDSHLERGGHAARSDYNRPTRNPATGDKKKGETPLQKAAREKYGAGASAMDIVKAKIKAQYGDKAIKDTKKD